MITILRFILFFLLASGFAVLVKAAGAVQDDFRIVDAGILSESVILGSVDGEICSYDSSGALLHQLRSIDGNYDLSGYQKLETSGATESLFSFLAEFVANKVASGDVKFKSWKRGDSIDKPLPDGRNPEWGTVQSRYWKNRYEASRNSGEFNQANLDRMRRGTAPQDLNPRTGNWESRELHHVNPQRAGGSNEPLNLRELTPDWHGEVDSFRNVPGIEPTRGIR